MTRMHRASWALAFVVLVGCGDPVSKDGARALPGAPDPAAKFVNPAKQTNFRILFNKNCRGCHGADGEFGPAPPLHDTIFLTIADDAELTKVVANGRKGTSMPAFAKSQGGTLTDEQVKILATGLRKGLFKEGFTPSKTEWPAYALPAEKGDVVRGRAVFEKACAICHGDDGKGTKDMGPINDLAFLELASEQFLRRIVITGRPDLGMPNSAESTGRPLDFQALTANDVNDVVALMMSWKKSPAK